MDEILAWLNGRARWLQEAATILLAKGKLYEEDIIALAETCFQEASAETSSAEVSFPANALQPHDSSSLRLCSIANVKGINRLAPRVPLTFGSENMAIVYGSNGSGKSGYVRILKHICGARNPGVLHPDVYLENSGSQSTDISYQLGAQELCVSWNPDAGVQTDLRHVDIFDAECGRAYLENENEVTYEPPVLSFFSDLISVCEQVSKSFDDRLGQYCSKKPLLPSEYTDLSPGKWYLNLKPQTTIDEIASYTKWSDEDEASLDGLSKRLTEQSPADKAKDILTKKRHLDGLISAIEVLLEKLSDKSCQQILEFKKDKQDKREAAQVAATKVFSGAPLKGIGSEAWKLLWEYARIYSEEYAYQEQVFPYVSSDARCVLCHQPLSEDARQRMNSFEFFVKGHAAKEAKNAEKSFEKAISDIGDIPTAQSVKLQCDAGGLSYEGDLPPIALDAEALLQRKIKLLATESVDELPGMPDCTIWLGEAKAQMAVYASLAEKYQEDAKTETRASLQTQLKELKARKWLFEQRTAIENEVERLKAVDLVEKAKRLADTRGLSRKKGEIAETQITDAFVQRFRNELVALGASWINVELVKKRVDHGRVLHELKLAKAQSGAPCEVLSEGEHRVVSLAAFLADVTSQQQSAPFVFDDPISSLDQDFENTVALRLVRLSIDRQVIIFTHRISLLVAIQEYLKKEEREPEIICIRSEAWGTGEPGSPPFFAQKPEAVLNVLLREKLPRAKRLFIEEGQEAYAPLAKSLCSDFRILLERMIEVELLADVVQRFRRAITTLGKLNKLPKIKLDDCLLLDSLMTKYSRHEHPQPIEAPISLPSPDEFQGDLEKLRDWRNEFTARRVQ